MKTIICCLTVILISIFALTHNSFSVSAGNNSDSSDVCIVSGEKLGADAVSYKYLNQNVKFCCQDCEQAFKKDPEKYLQSAALWCPVCDEGDAKKSISTVNEGVKYYFCSKGCKKNFQSDANKYLNNYK